MTVREKSVDIHSQVVRLFRHRVKGYRHRVKENIKLFELSVHIKRNVCCIFHKRRKKREPISILAYIEIMVNAHNDNLLFQYD